MSKPKQVFHWYVKKHTQLSDHKAFHKLQSNISSHINMSHQYVQLLCTSTIISKINFVNFFRILYDSSSTMIQMDMIYENNTGGNQRRSSRSLSDAHTCHIDVGIIRREKTCSICQRKQSSNSERERECNDKRNIWYKLHLSILCNADMNYVQMITFCDVSLGKKKHFNRIRWYFPVENSTKVQIYLELPPKILLNHLFDSSYSEQTQWQCEIHCDEKKLEMVCNTTLRVFLFHVVVKYPSKIKRISRHITQNYLHAAVTCALSLSKIAVECIFRKSDWRRRRQQRTTRGRKSIKGSRQRIPKVARVSSMTNWRSEKEW